MNLWNDVEAAIHAAGEPGFRMRDVRSIGGGCINETWILEGEPCNWFVKLNQASRLDMFEAEAEGLDELAQGSPLRVPRPLTLGTSGQSAFLVVEYIPLGQPADVHRLGEGLARQHQTTCAHYGWHRDNTIGATPQVNTRSEDWVRFWQEHRLGFQLRLAADKGHGGRLQKLGERLLAECDAFIGHAPAASLLHGDLWGGNCSGTGEGEPVIFDPAVYYGDREADLAMTELFGGFGRGFREAYEAVWPLDAGYRVRRTFYNLYHILNHLNLFGGHYGMQAENMMEQLLAEI